MSAKLTVEKALEEAGYWYPPDAIEAVRSGRDSYHPFDGDITFRLAADVRAIIQRAIHRAEHSKQPGAVCECPR